MLVDTHCHLQDAKFTPDRAAVIERALAVLDWFVVIGDDLANSRAAVALAQGNDRIYASVGMHPYHGNKTDTAALAELRALAGQPRVVALGETGLDYFNEFSPRAAQRTAFQAQLELTRDLGLPVVVHNREADADMLPMLREYAGELNRVIMHCYGSDAAFAESCAELGLYISFAGNLSYPKAQKLRDAAAVTPLARLLVETDAPYLAPQARRGQRCEPAWAALTAETLASIKGVSFETLCRLTTINAHAVYGVPGGPE